MRRGELSTVVEVLQKDFVQLLNPEIHSWSECQFAIPLVPSPNVCECRRRIYVESTCYNSNVWQASRRRSKDGTKIKRERSRKRSSFSLRLNSNQLFRRKTQTGAIRKKNVWKSKVSKEKPPASPTVLSHKGVELEGFLLWFWPFTLFTSMSKTTDMHL